MNNNRNQNNNRRRGRGNRNQGGGGGGGNQGNRIDSRARGNAPQMLDKYKKLAQDAQHHGDRVQAEYYLQFADHYFRVIADNRTRQDEPRGDQRGGRRDERDQDEFEADFESAGEFGADDRRRFDGQDRENRQRDGRERDDEDRDVRETEGREREGRGRPSREGRPDRPRRDSRREGQGDEAAVVAASEGPVFEPEDNPFTREASEPRAERPKRRAPRARGANDQGSEVEREVGRGVDAAALPSFLSNDAKGADDQAEDPAPRPRRKRSGGGTLSAVG